MSEYYNGNLEEDLKRIENSSEKDIALTLNEIGRTIGYGRAQKILQVYWAKYLKETGSPTLFGALLPNQLDKPINPPKKR